jgi:peptidoglycan-associated lipoprotein
MVLIMKKGLIFFTIALFFVAIGFSGCAKKAVKKEMGAEIPTAEEALGEPVEELEILEEAVEEPVEEVALIPGEELMAEPGVEAEAEAAVKPLKLKDVFFDYDRHVIRDDARETLYENARFLNKNKNIRITIQGHCDERGTIEYNIALGERRAMAVKRFLADLGVKPERIAILSFGKEKPFCLEHNEQCWQENRRAHIVLR